MHQKVINFDINTDFSASRTSDSKNISYFWHSNRGNYRGQVDGNLWVRTNGVSPRLRRPFTAVNDDHFEEKPYGGITIPEKSDIEIRITAASANNLDFIGGYDIILIKN